MQIFHLCLPSLSETLNNEMHCLSSFTGLNKNIHMWSKMAKGKGPKSPLFEYHNFYCSATYLKRQPRKGEGTKNAMSHPNPSNTSRMQIFHLCLPSLSETLNNEMHCLSWFTRLNKDIQVR